VRKIPHKRELDVKEASHSKISDKVNELLAIFSVCAGCVVPSHILTVMVPWLCYDKPMDGEDFLPRVEWLDTKGLVFLSDLLRHFGHPVKLVYLGTLIAGPSCAIPKSDLELGIIPIWERKLSYCRYKVFEELILSEGIYLNDLKMFHTLITSEVFKHKCKQLSMSNLSDIIDIHESVLVGMLKTDNIAKVYLSRGEALKKQYTNYALDHTKNLKRFENLQSKNIMTRTMLENFSHFACKPVSRLSRYVRIFEVLQRKTESYHPQRCDVDELVLLLNSILNLANDTMSKWRMRQRAVELNTEIGQKRLRKIGISSLLVQSRFMVKEGRVLSYPKVGRKPDALVEARCVLFNDVLLLIYPPNRHLQSIVLEHSRVNLRSKRTIFGNSVFGLYIRRFSLELVFFLTTLEESVEWKVCLNKIIPLSID